MSKSLVLKPRQSEKTYATSVALNTYVFDVSKSTNKIEVGEAVAAQYGVVVTNVRTMVVKGKKARSIRLGKYRKNVMGKRSDYKKAYVTLQDGDSLPIFAAVQEAEAAEAKAEEKAAKKAKKETK